MAEKTFNIPLRKEFLKTPRNRRTNKAVKAVKSFISRHMKSDNVKLGKALNEEIWKNGIRNPPHHVKVHALVDKDKVLVEKVGVKIEVEKPKEKKGKLQEAVEKVKGAPKTKEEKKAAKEKPVQKEVNKDAKSNS